MARNVRFPYPTPVTAALSQLGAGLRGLRAYRRMPLAYAADRALISRSTLHKVERGDPGVSLGIYASVLQRYGLLQRLESLVEAPWDPSRLPRRVRHAPTAQS